MALLAGDLTGKAIVPILERGGGYEAEVLGVHRRARDEQELNQKDASDTAMLLADHELAASDGPGVLNLRHVAALCASDWGLYTTVTDNLEKTQSPLDGILPDGAQQQRVRERAQRLVAELEATPKSGGWRRRARIGRRMRWYQTPDEADR